MCLRFNREDITQHLYANQCIYSYVEQYDDGCLYEPYEECRTYTLSKRIGSTGYFMVSPC